MKKIKLFADGVVAKKEYIDKIIDEYNIEGFTCNPTLIKQFLPITYKEYCEKIIEYSKNLPVSIQVLSNDSAEIEEQAFLINSWGENIYVKVPIVNNKGKLLSKTIIKLLQKNIKINITSIFTLEHVMSLFEHGLDKKNKSVLSIFSGRISDTGILPNEIIEKINDVFQDNRGDIELLWAGSRSMSDIKYAEKYCDIITLPSSIIDKFKLKNKNLNEYAIETVEMFTNDGKNFSI